MKEHKGMRPQDIVVLLKIISFGKQEWRIVDLANQLFISQSEVSEALNRCKISGLIDETKKKVRFLALLDFLRYGLKYVFPAQLSSVVRGIPTAHSAEPLSKKIISNDIYVWSDPEGRSIGQSIEPLYKNVVKAALIDTKLYEFLALVDALRIGRSKEIKLADEELKIRFNFEKKYLSNDNDEEVVKKSRGKWNKSFKEMSKNKEDKLLITDIFDDEN